MIDIIASAKKNKLPKEVIFEIYAIHEKALSDIAEQHYIKYKNNWKDSYKYAASVITSNSKDIKKVITKIPEILACAENTNFRKVNSNHFIHRIILTNQPIAVVQALINYSRMHNNENDIKPHIEACCNYINVKNNFTIANIKEVDDLLQPIDNKKINCSTLDAIKQLQSEIPDLHLEDIGVRMENLVPPNIGLKEETKKYMVCPKCANAKIYNDKPVNVCPQCQTSMKVEVLNGNPIEFFVKKILSNSNNSELFYNELKNEIETMKKNGISSDNISASLIENGMKPTIIGQFLITSNYQRFKDKVLQTNDLYSIKRG